MKNIIGICLISLLVNMNCFANDYVIARPHVNMNCFANDYVIARPHVNRTICQPQQVFYVQTYTPPPPSVYISYPGSTTLVPIYTQPSYTVTYTKIIYAPLPTRVNYYNLVQPTILHQPYIYKKHNIHRGYHR